MNSDLDIAVVSEDEVHHYDGIYTVTNPLTRLFGKLAENAGSVTICGPTRDAVSPPNGYSDSRIDFVQRPFYRSVTEFLKRSPKVLLEIHQSIRQCISDADYLIIRIPSPVALIAWLEAERQDVPYSVYVAGDLREVVYSGQKYSGTKKYLAAILVEFFHFTNQIIARGQQVFVVGFDLGDTFRDVADECTCLVPSLLSESEMISRREYSISQPAELLYCGRLVPVKGVDTLLESVAILHDQGVQIRLTIVGSGPSSEDLIALSRSLGIHDWVRFEGHVPFGDKLYEYYAQADVFALPSRSEGIPKTLLEAMGFRLPIITTNVGGIPDVVTDGETGILIEPDSPDLLADKLKLLINNRKLRSHLGENAGDFINKYTVDRQAEIIHQTILESH